MSTIKATLLINYREKYRIPSNYCPNKCLPTTFKLMTTIIIEIMHDHIEIKGFIPGEQKHNRRKLRGTKDQHLIDKMLLRNT